jgi:hypothetical protein
VRDALVNGIRDPSRQEQRTEGSAWFEKAMSGNDLEEKLHRCCAIKNKPNPALKDIIEVCTIFFGDAYDDFVSNVEDQMISVYNIRSEGEVYNVSIYPYKKAANNSHDPYDRPACMVLLSSDGKTKKSLDLESTRGMILLLCEKFVIDTDTKKYVLTVIKQKYKDETTTLQKQKEEAAEKARGAEKAEESRRQALISTLTNDQHFETWLAQVKALTRRNNAIQNSSKLIDQLLAAVRQKIHEET